MIMITTLGITECLKNKNDCSFQYIQMEVFLLISKLMIEALSFANSPWKNGYREMSHENYAKSSGGSNRSFQH